MEKLQAICNTKNRKRLPVQHDNLVSLKKDLMDSQSTDSESEIYSSEDEVINHVLAIPPRAEIFSSLDDIKHTKNIKGL